MWVVYTLGPAQHKLKERIASPRFFNLSATLPSPALLAVADFNRFSVAVSLSIPLTACSELSEICISSVSNDIVIPLNIPLYRIWERRVTYGPVSGCLTKTICNPATPNTFLQVYYTIYRVYLQVHHKIWYNMGDLLFEFPVPL